MSAAASRTQLQESAALLKRMTALAEHRYALIERVRRIALDHATCDCSAAVMILDVIGDK